jgi:hypothetical protein
VVGSTNLLCDREQINVAHFSTCLLSLGGITEAAIGDYMGEAAVGGKLPRHVSPKPRNTHKNGCSISRYFDYVNHENVKKIGKTLFCHRQSIRVIISINSMSQELSDIKIMRNACAHMSSNLTKTARLKAW